VSHDRIYQRLREHLAYLKLTAAAEVLAPKLDAAQKTKPSYTAFLEDLLRAEVEATERRRLAGRLRFAHFPVLKRLEDFDFDAQPDLDRSLVEELATLRFVEEKANVCKGRLKRLTVAGRKGQHLGSDASGFGVLLPWLLEGLQ